MVRLRVHRLADACYPQSPTHLQIPGEACHLEKDAGSCRENFTVRWFFDKEYGGCSRQVESVEIKMFDDL